MKHNLVITIGRESGSAGRHIGQLLANDLGVKCYDKELLTLAAKHSGLCEELFKSHDGSILLWRKTGLPWIWRKQLLFADISGHNGAHLKRPRLFRMDQLGLLVGSGLPNYKCGHQQSGRERKSSHKGRAEAGRYCSYIRR